MVMKQGMSMKIVLTMIMGLILLSLAGCGGRPDVGEPRVNIEAAEEVYSIGVNAYLWRATLDTLAFMPVLSADHQGGSYISDWKTNPTDVNERTKVDVFIVSKELSADSLNITIHREMLQNGNWVSAEPRPNAVNQLNSAIIIQARLLRRDNAPLTN